MKLVNEAAEFFVPDGTAVRDAFARTTDLCVSAHQDDAEIMAYGPIAECYRRPDHHFSLIVVTDGAGSSRAGLYTDVSDDQMRRIRAAEQKSAASIGGYSALALLSYKSSDVKQARPALLTELSGLIALACPDTLYTHSLADKHHTHAACALQVIEAVRLIPPDARPKRLVGCEAWRSLDWLPDSEKLLMDTSAYPNLSATLLGVFDSQLHGKRYDSASLGRRLANATFMSGHSPDRYASCSYGLDMTPLITDGGPTPEAFLSEKIEAFKAEALNLLK